MIETENVTYEFAVSLNIYQFIFILYLLHLTTFIKLLYLRLMYIITFCYLINVFLLNKVLRNILKFLDIIMNLILAYSLIKINKCMCNTKKKYLCFYFPYYLN